MQELLWNKNGFVKNNILHFCIDCIIHLCKSFSDKNQWKKHDKIKV